MKKVIILIVPFILTLVSHAQQVTQEWVASYLDSAIDEGDFIGLDAAQNVYVTGYSINVSKAVTVTLKYNPAAQQLWVARYDSGAGTQVLPMDMVTDQNGNVYIAAHFQNTSGSDDFLTLKYDSSGILLWQKRYDNGYQDIPHAIKSDAAGNVYVTGESANSIVGFGLTGDYITIKYSSSGQELWSERYDTQFGTPASHYDETAYGLTLDPWGGVYVTGRGFYPLTQTNGSAVNFMTLRYDSSGAQQWIQTFDAGNNDIAQQIVTDKDGNIFVSGTSNMSPDNGISVVKYDSSGQQLWAQSFDTSGAVSHKVAGMVSDDAGSVYLLDETYTSYGYYKFLLVKYSAGGQFRWIQLYDSLASFGGFQAAALSADHSGGIYVTGYWGLGSGDYITVRYDTSGTFVWKAMYNGTFSNTDIAMDVAVDGSGNVYVTGSSLTAGYYQSIATVKYSQPSGVDEVKNTGPEVTVFPSPSQGSSIYLSLRGKWDARFRIFDLPGNMVYEQAVSPGLNKINTCLAGGMYVYCVTDGVHVPSAGKILIIN